MSDSEVHWTALAVFIGLFLFVTALGFVAARWKPGDLNLLDDPHKFILCQRGIGSMPSL